MMSLGGAAAQGSTSGTPVQTRRRLIACCDGTWNSPDRYGHTTNVVRLVRSIKSSSSEGIPQIVYYHPGVGTGNIVDHWIGGGTGIGLSENVRSAYTFLVDNYMDGDEIFLFGFSRGAYTARSVAGMLCHVGLLRKHQMENFDEIWDCYRLPKQKRDQVEAKPLSELPDRVPPESIVVRCIGVWDTVGALGIPGSHVCQRDYQFHDTELGAIVEHAFQALAIDEERVTFKPAIWHRNKENPNQVLEQVWFPGVHSNIGGGYPEHVLSDAALFWMAAKTSNLLGIDQSYLCAQADRSRQYSTGRLVNSRTLSWRLTGNRYVRPICKTDPETEYIHESAWMRADYRSGIAGPMSHRGSSFQELLSTKKERMMPLSGYEKDILSQIPQVQPELILPRQSRRSSVCDKIVQTLGGGAK